MFLPSIYALLFAALLVPFVQADGAGVKVWFFEEPLFNIGDRVWVWKDECTSLENTSIPNSANGTVNSILINGDTMWDVMRRTDAWECWFYDNYECDDSDQDALYLFDGANSLAGEGWSNKILSVQCGISVD